jgi:hypothetical protein
LHSTPPGGGRKHSFIALLVFGDSSFDAAIMFEELSFGDAAI